MPNEYQLLCMTIDHMKQQGRKVVLKKLPSTVNRPRKSPWNNK